MSHDDKSTRKRWTHLEFSGENASLQCARIKTFVLQYTRTFGEKFILGHALRENNLTKLITVWRKEEKGRCVGTIVSDFYVIIKL